MNVVIGAMIKHTIMTLEKKIQDCRELLHFLEIEFIKLKSEEGNKATEIQEAWKEIQLDKSKEWPVPTIEQIFNRRVIDNGDRFHHYDRDGYKRNRRIGRFDNNYHNAETASKRQQNLDKIAKWAILDGVKQNVIDDFIIKYDLSAIEIARFENVMLTTYNNICVRLLNIYNDRWYATCYRRFNSNIPFEKP